MALVIEVGGVEEDAEPSTSDIIMLTQSHGPFWKLKNGVHGVSSEDT